jgi:hypothetical protein
MFEEKAEAQAWAKENKKSTGWLFGSHKISQDSDGKWGVYDKKNGVTHYRNTESFSDLVGLSDDGIISISTPSEKVNSGAFSGASLLNTFASATAKFMEGALKHESKFEYKFRQRIGHEIYSAARLTEKYSKEALDLASRFEGVGWYLGISSAALSWNDYRVENSTGNLLKAITNTILIVPRINPFVGVGLGVLELTGVTDKAFDLFGDEVDKQLMK